MIVIHLLFIVVIAWSILSLIFFSKTCESVLLLSPKYYLHKCLYFFWSTECECCWHICFWSELKTQAAAVIVTSSMGRCDGANGGSSGRVPGSYRPDQLPVRIPRGPRRHHDPLALRELSPKQANKRACFPPAWSSSLSFFSLFVDSQNRWRGPARGDHCTTRTPTWGTSSRAHHSRNVSVSTAPRARSWCWPSTTCAWRMSWSTSAASTRWPRRIQEKGAHSWGCLVSRVAPGRPKKYSAQDKPPLAAVSLCDLVPSSSHLLIDWLTYYYRLKVHFTKLKKEENQHQIKKSKKKHHQEKKKKRKKITARRHLVTPIYKAHFDVCVALYLMFVRPQAIWFSALLRL